MTSMMHAKAIKLTKIKTQDVVVIGIYGFGYTKIKHMFDMQYFIIHFN